MSLLDTCSKRRALLVCTCLCACVVLLLSSTDRINVPLLHTPASVDVQEDNPFVTEGLVLYSHSKQVDNVLMSRDLSDSMPSIKGTNITMQEIRDNFDRCKLISIAKEKKCLQVHKNHTLFWRSVQQNGFSESQDFKRMELATRCCAFNLLELMAPSPNKVMFPWEQDYLSQGPLSDMKDTAWASKSVVKFLNTSNKDLHVGDNVHFLIKIRTGRNKPRQKGGDSVRLWLVNEDLGASVTANVRDNKDGTYLASVVLPWMGKAVVKATIAHTRELFRSVLYVQRLFTTSHWFTGVFKNSKSSESTPCSPLSALPGFHPSEVCNMTETNGGVPWYCGRPVKRDLTCGTIAGFKKITYPSYQPLSEADENLVYLTESQRPFLIPIQITLFVKKYRKSYLATFPIPRTKCNKRNLSQTFEDPMSTGYFYKNKWRPFSCSLPQVDRKFTNNCLKNTTFILIGDSNTRAQINLLAELTKCTHKIIKTKVKWHAPLRCEIDKLALSIQFYPQKMPFYGSVNEVMTQAMLISAMTKLDSIPATGRYLILLHYFLHVMPFHLSFTQTRLQAIRHAIKGVLIRNPTALFIIQSPHSAYDHGHLNKHKMNVFLFHMTKSILKGLGDRVMFLNTMDITIASQNALGHPKTADKFMEMYLGHMCGRL